MIDQFLARLATTIASFFVATLVATAALGFLCGAAYLALLDLVSPPLAALATGLGALVLAVLIVQIARLWSRGKGASGRRRRARSERGEGSAEETAAEIGGILGAQLAALTRSHTRSTLAVSLLAGFAVGASPRLRKVLLDLVLPR
jgi:hypothetical protein